MVGAPFSAIIEACFFRTGVAKSFEAFTGSAAGRRSMAVCSWWAGRCGRRSIPDRCGYGLASGARTGAIEERPRDADLLNAYGVIAAAGASEAVARMQAAYETWDSVSGFVH